VVAVDGRPVAPPAPVVLAVHKPAGYVSTVRDPRGRPTVVALVPDRWGRLYPVGRLDADSEGLLLLTNDGDLTFLLTHPRHAVPRVYRVQVRPAPEPGQLRRLAEGVLLADGPTRPAAVRREGADWLRLTLREGRNRQVRRMCAAVGLEVLRLQRVAIGPVRLDGLRPGAWRRLAAGEVAALREAAAPRGGRGQETGPARRKAAPSRDRGGQARR
jgi:pseudouridine synthase